MRWGPWPGRSWTLTTGRWWWQRGTGKEAVFRSLSQAELHSVSAPDSPDKPSFLLGESPPGHNTTLPARFSEWWPALSDPAQ